MFNGICCHMKLNKTFIGLLVLGITGVCALLDACSKKPAEVAPDVSGFDKSAMLVYYADSLIMPGYSAFQLQLDVLEAAASNFLDAPDVATQEALRTAFKNAYQKFERVSVNQLGPAEKSLLSNFLNTFPADTAAIELNISRNIYNLTDNSSIRQQGLPALDYLLFANNALKQFNDSSSASRKKYVRDLISRMKILDGSVLKNWRDAYRQEFISNTRLDAGSPIAFMVNQFAYEMDQLKGPRIGWPYGKQSADGKQYPENTEGYYSGISVALSIENLRNLKAMFKAGGSGKGFSDYLVALDQPKLSADVLSKFDTAINSLNAVPDPLSTALLNNKPQLDAAYREIQLLLTLIKTDVASALGVRISYQDTDGD